MSLMTKQELMLQGLYIVVRTERGNAVVKTDPRQMPRRLRVLLLAIDGVQNVNLYTQTLRGFGDISELLVELVNLGMVELVEPALAKQQRETGRSNSFAALDSLLDDSNFNSQNAADLMYGTTAPGSFDEMVRVARIKQPQYQPPPAPAPSPVPVHAQREQIESVFKLLESVRDERKNLKHKISKLRRINDTAIRLNVENKRLKRWVYALGLGCALLATGIAFLLMTRH
jgi:hypothetical protein